MGSKSALLFVGLHVILSMALHERKAVGHIPRKGVRLVPITLTLHIFGFVITIRVKSENRHSAK